MWTPELWGPLGDQLPPCRALAWWGHRRTTPVTHAKREYEGGTWEDSQMTRQPSWAPCPGSQVNRGRTFHPAFLLLLRGGCGWGACGRFSSGLADQLDPVWPGSLWSIVSVERGWGSTRASGHIIREATLRPVYPYPLTSFPHGDSHALCKASRPLQPPFLSCSHTLPLGPPSLGHSLPRAHRAPREKA